VTDLPTPRAARLPRARWLDPRLLLGLLLVLLSVVLGAKIVSGADERVQVWSVTRDLGADTLLSGDDLEVTAVRLDGSARHYVAATEDLEGMALARPVSEGELLPVSAVASPEAQVQRRIVIEVDRVGVAGLSKGQVVDLYAVRETPAGDSASAPELVLAEVTVAEDVRSGGSGFGGGGSTAGVALMVDKDDVAKVIGAADGGSVYVVQVPTAAAIDTASAP
jgi:hypothetical protein